MSDDEKIIIRKELSQLQTTNQIIRSDVHKCTNRQRSFR